MSAPKPQSAARLALLARRARQEGLASALREPIAVVGMGCRFPGGADDPERFWELLLQGYDAVGDVPGERWSVEEWFDPDPATPGKSSVKAGAFLGDVAGFDAGFFGIPKREAERMDPHQRLALEVAWEALEDAGLSMGAVRGAAVGVFAASYNNDYVLHQYLRPEAINERTITGVVHSVVANRISHFLGLHGPSVAIDTACSSSLVAVHLACRSLREGGCDLAVAGGVSLMLRPEPFVALSKAGFMAPDGRCKTFDASADGFGRGEGCGFVVLKRLSDALAAGDRIDAVIRGTAVNQDGHSTVLAAPNGRAQVAVVRAALEDGQVPPEAVSYIEAHGTGTRLGDPIEVEALAEALGSPAGAPRWIASAKANVGHLEAAAGIAGLIKAVLSLRHRRIAPHIHCREENPLLRLAEHGFALPSAEHAWTSEDAPLTVGVSSFGVGGTNAHVVLEEAPQVPEPAAPEGEGPWLLPLAARSEAARRALALRYAELLERAEDRPDVAGRICAAAAKRSALEHRLAVAGHTPGELALRLRSWAEQPGAAGTWAGGADPESPVRPAFVFCGQGSQWAGMGVQLAREEPVFRETIQQIDALFTPLAGWSLLGALAGEPIAYSIEDTACAQPLIFAIQVGLAALLERWGVRPEMVIGHSVGEVAAAYVAGLLSLPDAVATVFHRGRVMQQAPADGAMLSARLSHEEAEALVRARAGCVGLAGINGPRSVVFSGHRDAVGALERELVARGVQVRSLAVRYGFHSAQMAPFEDELRRALPELQGSAARATFLSTVTGAELPEGGFDAAYIARNIVSPVRFHDAVQSALAGGANLFIELGPRAVLGGNLLESIEAAGASAAVVATLTQNSPGRAGALAAAGALFAHGGAPLWEALTGRARIDLRLPAYPWQRERCWLDTEERRPGGTAAGERGTRYRYLGRRLDSAALPGTIFERTLDADADGLADHQIGGHCLLPAVQMLETARAAGQAVAGMPVTVEGARFLRPVLLDADTRREVQWTLKAHDAGHTAALHSRPAGGVWSLAFSAEIRAQDSAPAAEPLALTGVQARCGEAIVPERFYAFAAALGCGFGPSFRRVEALFTGPGEALARLSTHDLQVDPRGEAPLPAALLDAALQPALALLGGGAGLHVPAALGRYTRLAPGLPRWSWVREAGASDQPERSFDVELFAEDGRPLARVEALSLAPAPPGFADLEDARSTLFEMRWEEAHALRETGAGRAADAGRYIVLADRESVARALAEHLASRGAEVELLPAPDEEEGTDGAWAERLRALRDRAEPVTWIHCGALTPCADAEPTPDALLAYQQRITAPVLDIVRSLRAGRADRLILLTRGVHDTDEGAPAPGEPWGAALVGLCRTVRRERPELGCSVIDLEAASGAELDRVLALLAADEPTEPVLALRGERVLVPRLAPLAPARTPPTSGTTTRAVHLAVPGDLASLEVRTVERRSPGAGEVEIEVRWAALNFRDVVAGLGLVSSRTAHGLGHECAGVVSRVGAGVGDLKVGDEVLAMAEGAFGDHVVCHRRRVFPKPIGLGWAEAATLPVAYLTAYHALDRVAALRAGQTMLIHSGAGGVGLAAVRLALARGATVFATAGTPEKRALLEGLGAQLVLDSRSTEFAERILAHTGGEGVDAVLNSLTGDAIGAGLSLLPRGGAFIELGKREIHTPEQVAREYPGVRYAAFDLFDEVDHEPELYQAAFRSLIQEFEAGRLAPLPYQEFPRRDISDAFRLMARGGHVGKILLRVPRPAARVGAVRAGATYLITGGTGEVGLASAEWLARRGARLLVLASRNEPGSEALQRIARLRDSGVGVEWTHLDVENPNEVRALVEELAGRALPLRGIVHAAGSLDDALLHDLDAERMAYPLRPKVLGAWNLARAVDPASLDFLLLYSAAGPFLDPAGQGNYAATNALLDALAGFLRGEGYPATSIAWGLWGGGMMERLGAAQRARWEALGLRPIHPESGARMLDEVLAAGRATVAALLIDWSRYRSAIGMPDPLLAGLGAPAPREHPENARSLPELWRPLPPKRLRAALREHVLERLARVLGRPAEEIATDRPFRELGLDSLMAVELRNTLTRDLVQPLSTTLAFDYPDLDTLSAHLAETLFPAVAAADSAADTAPATVPTPADELEAELLELSEAEAERLLLAELANLSPDARESIS